MGSRVLLVVALVMGVGVGVGVSDASSPGNHPSVAPTVDVTFTALAPPKVVLAGSVGANATKLVTVSAGTTTVPTQATTIRMTVTVKGTKAGSMSFYPAGDPAGSSGQTIAWPAGGTGAATITTDIGQKNQVAFVNSSLATATVKATITGWSSDVESGDISSLDGTTGQVLTDTGAGAAWQNPKPPTVYFDDDFSRYSISTSSLTPTIPVSVVVPAGRYLVQASITGAAEGVATSVTCRTRIAGDLGDQRKIDLDANIESAVISLLYVDQTGPIGGTVAVECWRSGGLADIFHSDLVVTPVAP